MNHFSNHKESKKEPAEIAKVTVGLMVYNEGKYLNQTIESILNQTYTNFQVIIADNCSTDGTEEFASEYVKKNKNILYHRHEENIGALENYNWLVRNAKSEYFVLAGAHDAWSTNYLEALLSALERDKEAVLAYAPTTWIDDRGNQVIEKKTGYIDSSGYSEIARFNMYIWSDQHALYGMCRRDALLKTRLQKKIVGSGAVLLAELSLSGSFVIVPEARWKRRITRKPETRNQALDRYAKSLFVSDKVHILPHWRIPIGYYDAVIRADLTIPKKLVLIMCVGNVFILRRNDLWLDIVDLLKRIFKIDQRLINKSL